MQIFFRFNLEKAIAAMAYLLHRLGPVQKVKLMKLLYIADRNHFLSGGHPITGSTQVAMDYGPVPSSCLSMLDGDCEPDEVFRYLHVENFTISVRENPRPDAITPAEQSTLDQIVQRYGAAPDWELVEHTHRFPEYEEVYVKGTSTRIPYELMLKVYGGEQRFRLGRPVVTQAMQSHMICPFDAGADADL